MADVVLKVTSQISRARLSLASPPNGRPTFGISNASHRTRDLHQPELALLAKRSMPRREKSLLMPDSVRVTKYRDYLIAPDMASAWMVMSGQTSFAVTRRQFNQECVSAMSRQ